MNDVMRPRCAAWILPWVLVSAGADGDGCACGRPMPSFEEVTETWPRWCGDGIVDPQEACDDGDHVAGDCCAPDCTIEPACVLGSEAPAESSDVDAGVTTDASESSTEPALATSAGPTSGAGTDSGTSDESTSGGSIEASRIVFITSVVYSGELEGLDGADAKCQQLGESLLTDPEQHRFMAWVSDETRSPSTRFASEDFAGRYVLRDERRTELAQGWRGLTSGRLDAAIDVDENGNRQSGLIVWSNTAVDGTSLQGADCSGWTGEAANGRVGDAGQYSGAGWTAVVDPEPCSVEARLYCFEVPV